MDDLEFVQSCVEGDKQTWDEFIVKYSRLIYSYIYSVFKTNNTHNLTPDTANDLFQDIILSLIKDNFQKLRSFKGKNGCSLASWLRQVTINSTIDYIRRLKPVVSIDGDNDDLSLKDMLPDNSPSAVDKFTLKEKIFRLKECIKILDTDDKYFLELHMNRGLSLEKLKDYLKISRGAIDMRKLRIVERLRDCFRLKGFALDL
jgi:RNA polymerase sigma-70 factor (ECF subfamily)